MSFRIHNTIQNDSIKDKIEEAPYVALEGASKISFQGVRLKLHKKSDGPLGSVLESTPEDT